MNAASAFVFDDRGRVLVVERAAGPNAGRWSVPGGKLEPGESLVAAAAREVHEETGLVVEIGPEVSVVAVGDYAIHAFVARGVGGSLAAASDAAAARFVDDAELAALPVTDGLVAVLARARATYAAWVSRSP